MVRKFEYRGIEQAELEALPLAKIFELFNSRQRRSLTRGITNGKRKLIEEIKSAKAGKEAGPIKTHVRDLIVLPYGRDHDPGVLGKRVSACHHVSRDDRPLYRRICNYKQKGKPRSPWRRGVKV
jgi:hypothetical protein